MSNMKAWFRKNVAAVPPTTSDMAIQQYDIDFVVELRKIAQLPSGQEIPWYFASTRTDNGTVFNIVGHIYRLLQNADAFKMCDSLVTNGIATYAAGGQIGEGERVYLLLRLPDTFEVVPGDEVASYIGVFNSHDGNSSLFVMPLAVRSVSDATLNVAFATSTMMKFRHTTNLEGRLKDLNMAVQNVQKEFGELEIASRKLLKLKLDDTLVDKFMHDFISGLNNIKVHPKTTGMYESIIKHYQFGTGQSIAGVAGTGWAMFAGICEWADYSKSTRIMDDKADADSQRTKSILFGDGQGKKQQALELLLKMYDEQKALGKIV